MYFDDIIGDDAWLCNEFTGERLAIREFNQEHRSKKICKNYYVVRKYPNSWWADLVHIFHDFDHPRGGVRASVCDEEPRSGFSSIDSGARNPEPGGKYGA
jgi:hypothetical protein